MSGKSSGVKGDTFERAVAKFFNNVYTVTQFGKSPSSGARMGRSNFAKNAGLAESAIHTMVCDLITPDSFPFVVECKFYADSPSYHILIKDKERSLDKWLQEVEFDAKNVGKLPMLVFKTNKKGIHFAVPRHTVDMSQVEYYTVYRDYVIFGIDHYDTIKAQLWPDCHKHALQNIDD